MSERTQAASVLLAVQAAFRANQRHSDPTATRPSLDGVLGHLKAEPSLPIGELASRSGTSAWDLVNRLQALQEEGLVYVDSATDTVALTSFGQAAVDKSDV